MFFRKKNKGACAPSNEETPSNKTNGITHEDIQEIKENKMLYYQHPEYDTRRTFEFGEGLAYHLETLTKDEEGDDKLVLKPNLNLYIPTDHPVLSYLSEADIKKIANYVFHWEKSGLYSSSTQSLAEVPFIHLLHDSGENIDWSIKERQLTLAEADDHEVTNHAVIGKFEDAPNRENRWSLLFLIQTAYGRRLRLGLIFPKPDGNGVIDFK